MKRMTRQSISIDSALWGKVLAYANYHDLSISQVIRRAIKEFLNREGVNHENVQ